LGVAFRYFDDISWYAVVGSSRQNKIRVNFGDKPFVFNIRQLLNSEQYRESLLKYADKVTKMELEDESDSDDEEGYNLQEVGSDVEVDPTELDGPEDVSGRFEEVNDEAEAVPASSSKGKKRSAEGMDVDDGASPTLSKAEKKRAKKQKGENGEAVPTPAPEGEKKKDKKQKKTEDVATSGELKEITGGLKYRDVKTGDGASAKTGSNVKMRYIGKLTNGEIFDKNVNGKPFTFRLGAGDVIKGWDIGIAGMKVGGERELVIPPTLGYGKRKSGTIPPNSTLRFEVKLIGLDK